MDCIKDIKKRNIKLIEEFRKEFNISQSLEEILSYESLQVHKEVSKNRARFMGLLKTFEGLDENGKRKYKIKRIQLYSHKINTEDSPRIFTVYDFIRVIHMEYKRAMEIENFEDVMLPYHLQRVPEYAELLD